MIEVFIDQVMGAFQLARAASVQYFGLFRS